VFVPKLALSGTFATEMIFLEDDLRVFDGSASKAPPDACFDAAVLLSFAYDALFRPRSALVRSAVSRMR
jgi:hypothetical protein